MNILAIAGSLRAASINLALCRAAARLAPHGQHVEAFTGMGALPLFNPDLETNPPQAIVDFRRSVERADALLIASPEYAHGVSGVMKNALDWLVSFEGFVAKPVALVNTSPRARIAYESLLETLRTMSATIVPEASIVIPLLGACVTEEAMVESVPVSSQIRQLLASLQASLDAGTSTGPFFPVSPQ